MKGIILFFASILMLTTTANAQYALSASNFAGNIITGSQLVEDSVSTCYSLTGMPGNIGTRAAYQYWDFTGLSYYYTDTPSSLRLYYPGYSYQEYATHIIKPQELYYAARSLYTILSSGITKYGEKLDGKAYPLGAGTGVATDSIVFPVQVDMYSSPYTKLYLPATYGTTWSSSLNVSTNFLFSYAAKSYNHASCTYKSYLTEKDTVIGYGYVQVNNVAGVKSAYIPVIEVKTIFTQTDSFYVGPTPIDATTLTTFGLSQGEVTNAYDYKFYRAAETTPIVDVAFGDNTFNPQNIVHTYVQTQALPPATSVPVVTAQDDISIYPNPAVNHMFTMHVPSSFANSATYRVVNVTGQEVVSNSISAAGDVTVQIPASAAPGIYYLQLYNNSKPVSMKQVEVR